MNLSPLAVQKFFDNNSRPLVGGLLFTYAAGTSTKIATYQTQSGTPNTNPVVLNFRGEANVWLDPTLTYKFVLAPATDTDPPTNPIWTVDDIAGPLTILDITQQFLGEILWPQTPAEISAGVTPTNYAYYPRDGVNVKRFGVSDSNSASANTLAFQRALDSGEPLYIPRTTGVYDVDGELVPAAAGQFIYGDGYLSRIRQVTANLNVISAAGLANLHFMEKLLR